MRLYRAVVRIVCRVLLRYRSVRYRDLEALGSSKSLQTMLSALKDLEKLDHPVADYFSSENYILFHSVRSSLAGVRTKVIGVPDSYLAWGEHGVIAFLLYVFFAAAIREQRIVNKEEVDRLTSIEVAKWLRKHEFEPQLIETFENSSK